MRLFQSHPITLHRHKSIAHFTRDSTGSWQAGWRHLEIESVCHCALMAPAGQHIIAISGETDMGFATLYQYDLSTQQAHIVALGYSIHNTYAFLRIAWAPVPAAWPRQLYAYVHDTFPPSTDSRAAVDQSVRLVDSSTHGILGSWRVADGTRAANQQDMAAALKRANHLKWSANGKHLAVFCTDWVQVLRFDRVK